MDDIRQRLWQISVGTSPAAEPAVAELLGLLTGVPAFSFQDFERKTLTVSATFVNWPQPRAALLGSLEFGLQTLRRNGMDPAPGRITVRRLPQVDWAESWKAHFPDLEIGVDLLIRPGWSRRRARPGQFVVELDPGLSFGTGHHPTTRFCLEELVRCRPGRIRRSMLDIGTGSGLLAIAAAKLGYRPVAAWEVDPVALRTARANAGRNRVQESIRFECADLREPPVSAGCYDVVCANLQADLLLDHVGSITRRVLPAGRLILAGITRSEQDAVRQAYAALGFKRERSRTKSEWVSLALRATGGGG